MSSLKAPSHGRHTSDNTTTRVPRQPPIDATQSGTPSVPPVPATHHTRATLPAWPLVAFFVGYPLWWLLGLASFLPIILGATCLTYLRINGGIRLPTAWMPWLGFLIWTAASATMIDSPARLIGFGYRWLTLIGISMLALYAFNAPQRLPRERIIALASIFMVWMAIGGIIGMISPYARVTTPLVALLPPSVTNNDLVQELLVPRFAEVQHPWGAEAAFVRPSAPFPYTNAWGHAFVLLVPLVVAWALSASTRTRTALVALLAVAALPALATLNRGMFLGLGFALCYLWLRYLRRVPLRAYAIAIVAGGILGAMLLLSGTLNSITDRTSTSSTTQDRAELYTETYARTLESPILGWGAPRPSTTLNVSVGTQGQLWYLMFSHGFVGMALYVGTLVTLAWRTRQTRSLGTTLLHAVLVTEIFLLAFYGTNDLHLLVVFLTAMALLPRTETAQPALLTEPDPISEVQQTDATKVHNEVDPKTAGQKDALGG